MPRLGKRPAPATLRLQLSSSADAGNSSGTDEERVTTPPPRNHSPTKRPRHAPLPLQLPTPPTALPQGRRGSNFTRSGCLSPTDSAPLLQQSLVLAAAQRGKQLSESEEFPPPEAKEPKQEKDLIGDYALLSQLDKAGLSFHALHTPTNTIKTCQVVSQKQLIHLLKVRQRLNTSRPGTEAVEAAILPPGTEVLQAPGGKNYLFSPQTFGSLHSYVQSRKKLSEDEARGLYKQIVEMVAHAHELGIVVRDLKLRQFVFADAGQTRLRMGSVGDVVVLEDAGDDRLSDRHGCPAYVSPEILDLGQPSHSGRAADVWSLGVLLFVMLLGRYPFYDQTPGGLFGKIREGVFAIPREEGLSLEVLLLLRALLRRRPHERPAAATLAHLPWLQQRPRRPHPAAVGTGRPLPPQQLDQVVPGN